MEKKVIQFNKGEKTDDFKQREREAMFSFYQKRKEQVEYNPIKLFVLLAVVGWCAVYGAYQAVMNYVVPFIKMFF